LTAAASADPNLGAVELVALALGPVLDELVLVGGCAVGLLVTDPARTPVRATLDVDLLTEVAPLASYYQLAERLRRRGFAEQSAADVVCRWAKGELLIDVLPVDAKVLGFTNTWYAQAAHHARLHPLPSGRNIRLIAAPHFLATKLEAFASRGGGDYLHHDMEDIVTVIDGRHSIVSEVQNSPADLRAFLLHELRVLLADTRFMDRLSWLLPPENLASRRDITITRMRQIAGL
jgi:predicted nucleotidyltransferase